MPKGLKLRAAELKKKFSQTKDFETRQAKAKANREAFNGAIAKKAAEETDKVMNAQSRKAIAVGSEGKFFSVGAGEDSTEATTGWGAAKALPPRLSQRLDTLQKQFQPKDDFETRQAKAKANREAFNGAIAKKAAEESDKVMNANSRRQLATGNANTFTVDFSSTEEEGSSNQGWGKQSNRLPANLAARLASLNAQFKPESYSKREAKAAANRAAFLKSVAQKASDESDKLANAKTRRSLAEGDASHFTVDFAAENSVEVRGWGYKPPMPPRLQSRLEKLKTRFEPTDYALRAARADTNRAAFHASLVQKAAEETEKVANAQSRKKLVIGNENIFSIEVKSEAAGNGWGVPVKLPAHLATRVNKLQQRFSGNTKTQAEKQKAAKMKRDAYHASIANKARALSAERVLAAQSRKQLMNGNDECFRVEFVKADGGEVAIEEKSGWGTGSPGMPKRLASRAAHFLKTSPTKQNLDNAMNKASGNRSKHLDAVRAKASKTIAKMEAARVRKLQNEMDAGIVLLNTAQQRKLSPVKLPQRLSERVEKLTLRFGYDGAEREKRVEENRIRRLNEIRTKAQTASKRIQDAKKRRTKIKRKQQLERISAMQHSSSSYEEQPVSTSSRRPSSCEKAKEQGCVIS